MQCCGEIQINRPKCDLIEGRRRCVFSSDLEEARAEISLKLSRYASRQQPEDIPVPVISEGRFRQVIIAAHQQSAPMVLLRLSESAAAV